MPVDYYLAGALAALGIAAYVLAERRERRLKEVRRMQKRIDWYSRAR